MNGATESRSIEAIENIIRETGFPPSPEELAAVLGTSIQSVQGSLVHAKNRGRVYYDDQGNLLVRELDA